MRRIFSTDGLDPRERYDCWHEIVCKHIIVHDSVPDCRVTFAANVDLAVLGKLALVYCEMDSLTAAHEERHIGASADDFLLLRAASGRMLFTQNGRNVSLGAGEMTVIEPRMVYSCRLEGGSALLIAKCPRQDLEARVGSFGRFLGRKLTAQPGECGLLSDFLRILPAHAEALTASAPRVSDQLLDLLAAGLWRIGAQDGAPRLSSPRRLLEVKLRAAIERRLMDHTASVQSIADCVGISLRYANAILADDNTSVGRLLQARRLEQCRRDLADPAKLHSSISNIAYLWGFTDMTHFGRRFRQAFGLLPRDYRNLQRNARTSVDS